MSLPSTMVWEIETGGSDTNGGGFNSAASGTDFTQGAGQNTITFNGSTTTGTTAGASATIGISGQTVANTWVGNTINITGGTNFITGRYVISSVNTGGSTITVDRNATTGVGAAMTGTIGGALASPAVAYTAVVAANTVWIKAGTYTISTTTTNVANGCLALSIAGGNTNPVMTKGYNTTRGDLDALNSFTAGQRPLLQASSLSPGANTYLVAVTGQHNEISAIQVDGQTGTSTNISGINLAAQNCRVIRSLATNCPGTAGMAINTSASMYVLCETSGNGSGSTGGFVSAVSGKFIGCVSHGHATAGFSISQDSCVRCISYGNTTANGHGFVGAGSGVNFLIECTADSNVGDGFNGAGTVCLYMGCLATNSTLFGFIQTAAVISHLYNCGGYNNTSGNFGTSTQAPTSNENFVAASVAPYAAGVGNFALNNTANGGAALRATGTPGTFPAGASVGAPDIGAVQTSDAGTGGGGLLYLAGMVGGMIQ